MKSRTLVLAVLITSTVAVAAVQERVKRKTVADFPTVHAEIGSAWKAQKYGLCMERTRDLLTLITIERTAVILAAFPPAPAGYEIVPRKQAAETAANPFAASMMASIGSIVERKYRATEGRGSVQMTVTADSPLVQMFSMWITNPAMLGEGAELIKYGQYNAVLKPEGSGWSLTLLIAHSLCEVKTRTESDEFLLKVLDQAAVDRLAKAILE